MSSTVELIKEKLSISEVVSSYIKLEHSGENLKGKCPFHNEKTPSFFVSPGRGSFYCFGCGAKGDIFSFVEQFEKIDFKGALKILADRAGIPLVPENPKQKDDRDKLFDVMEEATVFFEINLSKNEKEMKYLKERGLDEKTIALWRLGFAQNEWRVLSDYLKGKGFENVILEKAGLIKQSEENIGSFYDRFRGRIMFPLYDGSGRVIAFSGRSIFNDEKIAKYLNSPDTPLFRKSEVLYGYDKAKHVIREKNYSIIVEGQLDLLMAHQAGFQNAVASSGTALTASHVEMLKRLSGNLMIAYDSDRAGLNASLRAWSLALHAGMDVKIAVMPQGEDPASLILKDVNLWKEALKDSKHIITYYLDSILATGVKERKLGREVGEKVLPYVKAVKSSIEQSHFLEEISKKTGIPIRALQDDMNAIKTEQSKIESQEENIEPAKIKDTDEGIEKKILSIILWQESKEKADLNALELRERLEKVIGQEILKEMEEKASERKDELIFEAEIYHERSQYLKNDVEELFVNLEKEDVKRKFTEAMRLLHEAEREGNVSKTKELLEECQRLSKRLSELNNVMYNK